MSRTDPFWAAVAQQLEELRSAKSADDVLRILSPERNPYVTVLGREPSASADAFFAGSGGEDNVETALRDTGWQFVWMRAGYWWAMRAPNGDVITYVEGDIYRGDRKD